MARELIFDILAIDRASAVFSRVGAEVDATGAKAETMGKMAGAAFAGLAVGAVILGAKSVQMAADFQTSITKLQTTAGESADNLKVVGDGLLTMAGKVGFTADELAKGMYFVESAGFHGADGLKVMEAAAKGARIEGSDLTDTTRAVAAAMVDFKGGAYSAADVTNILTQATGRGMLTFQQMADAFPKIGARAQSAGLSLGETTAAIATMTQHGTEASTAATYLGQMIGQIEAPSPKARAAMKGLGIDANALGLQLGKQGLAASIQTVQDAINNHLQPSGLVAIDVFKKSLATTGDYNAMMAKLPPNVRTTFGALAQMTGGVKSLQAWLQLGGQNLQTFKDNTVAVNSAVHHGSDEIQGFNEQQQTLNGKLGDITGSLSAVAIKLGDALTPAVGQAMDEFKSMLDFLNTSDWGAAFGTIGDAAKVQWPKNVAIVRGADAAISDEISKAWDTMKASVRAGDADISASISSGWDTNKATVRGADSAISDHLSSSWDSMKQTVRNGDAWISNTLSGDWYAMVGTIGNAFSGIVGAVEGPIKTVLSFISNNFVNPLNSMLKSVLGGSAFQLPTFSDGGAVGAYTYGGKFATGGYTGAGSKYQPAGIVHAGEYVFTQEETSRAGAGNLAALAKNLRGYDVGGLVSGVAGAIGNAAHMVTDPLGAVKALIGSVAGGLGGGLWGQTAGGVLGKIGDGLASKIQGLLSAVTQQVTGGPLTSGSATSAGAGSAVAWAQSMLGATGWLDKCLAFVNAAWGHSVPWLGTPRAIDAWNSAPNRHPGDMNPPAGAALFYTTGNPAGHVDLSLGGNSIISTDLPSANRIGLVNFNTPMSQWGAHYLGSAMPGYASGGLVRPPVFDRGGVLSPGINVVDNQTGRPEHLSNTTKPVTITRDDLDYLIAGFHGAQRAYGAQSGMAMMAGR